jgi:hypothetical protein
MSKNINDKIASLSPEQQSRIEARAKELIDAVERNHASENQRKAGLLRDTSPDALAIWQSVEATAANDQRFATAREILAMARSAQALIHGSVETDTGHAYGEGWKQCAQYIGGCIRRTYGITDQPEGGAR